MRRLRLRYVLLATCGAVLLGVLSIFTAGRSGCGASEAAARYAEALVTDDTAEMRGVATGVAGDLIKRTSAEDNGRGRNPIIKEETLQHCAGVAQIAVTAVFQPSSQPGVSLPLFLKLFLVHDRQGTWRVYAVEATDPEPGSRGRNLPLSAGDQEAIATTMRGFVDAAKSGDLEAAAAFLGGRAWLSGETVRAALGGKPLLPEGMGEVAVEVIRWAPPVATAVSHYRRGDGLDVRWLAQLYRLENAGGAADAAAWRIVRMDPL